MSVNPNRKEEEEASSERSVHKRVAMASRNEEEEKEEREIHHREVRKMAEVK